MLIFKNSPKMMKNFLYHWFYIYRKIQQQMRRIFLITMGLFYNFIVVAQDSLRVKFALESWNDVVNNLAGGIKQGTVYKGLLAFDPEITYGNVGFKGSLCYSFGKSPSKYLVGDMHTLSNIDADIPFFIFESYFFWKKNGFSLKTGIINMNEEFISCERAEYLINSSFGIPLHITHNSPVSIYPKTTIGANVLKKLDKENYLKLGIYDGFPKENKLEILKSAIHINDGLFFISEFHNKWKDNHTKIGFYHHTGSFVKVDSSKKVEPHNGFYFIMCSTIYSDIKFRLSVFSQLSRSLGNIYRHHYYLGGGLVLNINHPNEHNIKQLAFGVAYIGDRLKMQQETAIELVFAKSMGKYILFEPDVQYIVNPSGCSHSLNNALTLNFRLLFRIEKS